MTKSLTLGILFSTAVREVVVPKLVISGILSSISLNLALYTSFLTTFLSTKSLNVFKSTATGFNLSASNSANLSISNLSTSDFKFDKSSFIANYDEPTPVAFFKSDFVA